MACGAWDVDTACRIASGCLDGLARPGLDDLVGPDAARAHPEPLNPAVHQRADALKVGLKRLGVTLCAWLMLRPTTGPFPQISQRFAMVVL